MKYSIEDDLIHSNPFETYTTVVLRTFGCTSLTVRVFILWLIIVQHPAIMMKQTKKSPHWSLRGLAFKPSIPFKASLKMRNICLPECYVCNKLETNRSYTGFKPWNSIMKFYRTWQTTNNYIMQTIFKGRTASECDPHQESWLMAWQGENNYQDCNTVFMYVIM